MQANERVSMLSEERRQHILTVLRQDGRVLAADLSRHLGVSEDTIRRDLRELAQAGALQRVHGGALPRSPSDPQFAVRERESPAAKAGIARAAAKLVTPHSVVILDAGTTTVQIAHALSRDLPATVVTNSPPIAIALSDHHRIKVIVLGGELYTLSLAAIGPATIEALASIHADLCFLGVAGIHPDAGTSILAHEEVFVKRAMIASAVRVVAVASGEKLGTLAPFGVAPITSLGAIVTERDVPDSVLAPYREREIEVIQA